MPTKPSKPSKPKQGLSPNHVSHVHAALRSAKSSHGFHPLLVPPAPDMGGGDNQMIPAKTGEYIIPSEVVARKGTQFFDNLIKKTLEEVIPSPAASKPATAAPATARPASIADLAGSGTAATGFRWGGEVGERGFNKPAFNNPTQQWQAQPAPVINTPAQPAPSWQAQPEPFVNYQDAPGGPNPDFWGSKSVGEPPAWSDSGLDARASAWSGRTNPWLDFTATAPFGYTPPGWPSQGQGPTAIPTFWNPQGYPYAVPVTGDYGVNSGRSSTYRGRRRPT